MGARLAALTSIAVLFDTIGGVESAIDAVRRRSGGILDPRIADHFVGRAEVLLREVNATDCGLNGWLQQPLRTSLMVS